MICIHHNDLDGKCAAAIVKKYFGSTEIIFHETDYKDTAPLTKLAGEDVIIVDFSYPPEVMLNIVELSNSVVWIDHHATAKDYPYQYLTGLRNFEDKKFSGCELAWMFYFPMETMPLSVQLIGDYDKWALKLKPECFQFYEGMKVKNDTSPQSLLWELLLQDNFYVSSIIDSGCTAVAYRDNYCNDLCKSFGYETEISGHGAYACNQFMFGSGGFGHRFHQYPLCIAYIHDGEQFTVSMYSETVDVGQIAKTFGGGGHKGAAGFVCKNLPFTIKL
jgi:oligoribonuclease NrnB/cAMP/cGMP phosphodiesterase (DHH superfamily)